MRSRRNQCTCTGINKIQQHKKENEVSSKRKLFESDVTIIDRWQTRGVLFNEYSSRIRLKIMESLLLLGVSRILLHVYLKIEQVSQGLPIPDSSPQFPVSVLPATDVRVAFSLPEFPVSQLPTRINWKTNNRQCANTSKQTSPRLGFPTGSIHARGPSYFSKAPAKETGPFLVIPRCC